MATTLISLRTKFILMWIQGVALILLVMISTINLNGFRYEVPRDIWGWISSLSPFLIAFIMLFGLICLSKVPTKEDKGSTRVVPNKTQEIEYKSELIEIPPRFKDHIINGEMAELNSMFNTQITEGWELVTYTYVTADDTTPPALIITYKKIQFT